MLLYLDIVHLWMYMVLSYSIWPVCDLEIKIFYKNDLDESRELHIQYIGFFICVIPIKTNTC